MAFIDLTTEERTIAISALQLAKRSVSADTEFDRKHLEEVGEIETALDNHITSLKPLQRAILIGCLNQNFIFPNEDLFKIHEFDLIFRDDQLSERLIKVDAALELRNKLKNKSERRTKLFKEKLENLDSLTKAKKIHFSKMDNGHIYKAGILIGKGKGARFELGSISPITVIKIENLGASIYENSGTLQQVLDILLSYSASHELTESQKSFQKLLELMVRNSQG